MLDHAKTSRIVHDLPEAIRYDDLARPATAWMPELHELLRLVADLRAAGHDVGEVLDRITAINHAIDRAITADKGKYVAANLLDLDPADIGERVRQYGIDLATREAMGQARRDFDRELARGAARALRDGSDGIIEAMRREFDPALGEVKRAADAGITADTDPAALLDTAPPATIKAYRALSPAVDTLDRIAALRLQMCDIAGIGPQRHPVACFLAEVTETHDLEGATNRWRGVAEYVQYDLPMTGSHLAKVRRPQIGGRWLALVAGGYRLRLNTADQADAIAQGPARS
jgi:hypothetical protein